MKTADLVTLKQMSAELLEAIPQRITMDGKGNLFCAGEPIEVQTVLADIELTIDRAERLDKVIQSLEGRKIKS